MRSRTCVKLSKALHEEFRTHNVTVSALCPGPTESEFAAMADLHQSRLFRKSRMSAADVARIGVDGYEAGRAIVVTGLTNRVGSLASQLVPRWVSCRIAGRLQA